MNFLVAKNGSQLGPFSESDIRAKIASGELAASDFGWKEGMASWLPLSQIFSDAPSQSAPPVHAPQEQNNPGNLAPQPYNAPQGQYSTPQTYNSPYPSPYQQGAGLPWGAQGSSGYAGFWLRVVAIIIDTIILNIVMFVVGFVLGLVLGATHLASQNSLASLLYALSLVVNWLYFTGLESSASQATLGKQILGLKVTDLNGGRIGFGQATGRYFGKIISALLLGVGLIMAAFTERKQGLHDIMASTLVMRK